jgi:predicted flap endonuclease-1-like 5' DNA nuclease
MSEKKVMFTLPAHIAGGATSGVLLGQFNNWDLNNALPLEVRADGSLAAYITLETGRSYEYRYLLDDGRWVNDDHAERYVHINQYQIENCVITLEADLDAQMIVSVMQPQSQKTTSKITTTVTRRVGALVKSGSTSESTTISHVAAPVVVAESAAVVEVAPVAAPAKKAANKPDDLTIIEGIGKKIAELLVADGIITFQQLAETSVERLQGILDAAGNRFRMHNPGTWAQQSALAAEGKMDELKTLQDNLKGGRAE